VDEIHISSYPDAPRPSDATLSEIAAYIRAPITIQDFDAFRWHRTAPRQDYSLTNRIFSTCQLYHSWDCHTLIDGWFYPCPQAALWGNAPGDGVDLLSPNTDQQARLTEVLGRTRPLQTCTQCLGSVGRLIPHRLGWRRNPDWRPTSELDGGFLQLLEGDPDAHNHCYEYRRTVHPSGRVEVHSSRPRGRRSEM
jgi:hypothetical protein